MKAKIQEIFNAIDEKNQHYVLIGIILFVILLDFFILMRPQLLALAKIRSEVKTIVQDIEKIKEDTQRLDSYKSEIKRLEDALAAVGKIRPKQEVPVALEQISRVASQAQVKIDQMALVPGGERALPAVQDEVKTDQMPPGPGDPQTLMANQNVAQTSQTPPPPPGDVKTLMASQGQGGTNQMPPPIPGKEIAPPASGADSGKVIPEEKKRTYSALPVLIEARSGYHYFGRFLNLLEQSNLSLNIASFSMGQRNKGSKDGPLDQALPMNLGAMAEDAYRPSGQVLEADPKATAENDPQDQALEMKFEIIVFEDKK